MANIKSLDSAAKKFAQNAAQAGGSYAEGVANPKRDWAQATSASEASFEQGVQSAISKKSFGKGVKKAGSAKWQKGATEKGSQRFAAGVSMASDKYKEGFQPFHNALSSVTLPPRFAKRDPRNLERVKATVNTMIQVKEKIG